MVEYSRFWHAYFMQNAASAEFCWNDSHHLTPAEENVVSGSIQQFQLGEGSDGAGLLRRAQIHARKTADPLFVPALQLFVLEEQRHSAWLGRFLDREGIPRLSRHWLDTVFRRLRKLAGLE